MISMEIDIINPYVLRILISARKKDSINSIANRIGLSYGWTHNWVNKLAKKGVFKLTRMNAYLNENNLFYKETLRYIKIELSKSVQFHYEVLSLLGIEYCFTKTDAVFVWTKGGYNIGRFKEFHPIFIKVKKSDKELFENYCKRLKLNMGGKRGIFYQVEYLDKFEISHCEEVPVDSLKETIAFMQKYMHNFEPALEMIQEMYKKKIGIRYKELVTNV